ncbi:MAG: DoxX family protein [Polyangiaceae bacterium]
MTAQQPSKALLWTGRVLSTLPVLLMTMSAIMKLTASRQILEGFVNTMGYPENTLIPIGIVELSVAIIYAIPRTAVLGAILITGYLGGATATHVRISDVFVMPVLVGVMAWAGLWIREARLRELIPLRKRS